MKKRDFKFFTASVILSSLMFIGCGGQEGKATLLKQPHDTSKLNRSVSPLEDWTWHVSFRTNISSSSDFSLYADYWEGIPSGIVNFQYFIDVDRDSNTGFSGSNGWEIYGADYLIENDSVYKSLSNNEWKWKYIGKFNSVKHATRGSYTMYKLGYPDSKLANIFNKKDFKVMIESYDQNWDGNYNTITGIDAEVNIDTETSTQINKELIEKKIIEGMGLSGGYTFTSFFASNNDYLVMVVKGFGRTKIISYDLSDDTYQTKSTIIFSDTRTRLGEYKFLNDRTFQFRETEYHGYSDKLITYDLIDNKVIQREDLLN